MALYALAAAIAVGAVALFPAFMKAWIAEQSGVAAVAAEQGNSNGSLAAAQAALASEARLLVPLSSAASASSLSDAVKAIASARGPVTLSSFSAVRMATGTVAVIVQGIAPTRDDLLAFQSRLEALVPGASVDLPISELAKSSRIGFSLQVTGPLP
ncbi:MAG: hypothetical protein KGI69_04050 [Patescibacteria group bacterium]|nr:hypothetical protein [Patescibacteria group bacterium]